MRADAPAFTALLTGWNHSGRVLEDDPTPVLTACLRDAADGGLINPDANVRRFGEVLAAGLLGAIHQWTASLLSDRAFATRARAVVDVVFAAARSGY